MVEAFQEFSKKSLEAKAKTTCPEWKNFYQQLADFGQCKVKDLIGREQVNCIQPPAPKTPCPAASSGNGGSSNIDADRAGEAERQRQADVATQQLRSSVDQVMQNEADLNSGILEMDLGNVNNALDNANNLNTDLTSRLPNKSHFRQPATQPIIANAPTDWNTTNTDQREHATKTPPAKRTDPNIAANWNTGGPGNDKNPITSVSTTNLLETSTATPASGAPASQDKPGNAAPDVAEKESPVGAQRETVAAIPPAPSSSVPEIQSVTSIDAKAESVVAAVSPVSATPQPANNLSANQLMAFQQYRWAERMADGQRFRLALPIFFLEQTDRLLGGPTPRTQFLRVVVHAQELTKGLGAAKSYDTRPEIHAATALRLSRLQQLTDTVDTHLNHYLRLADPTDSRYAEALRLQSKLTLQRTEYQRADARIIEQQRHQQGVETLKQQVTEYEGRAEKARKGRGLFVWTALGFAAYGVIDAKSQQKSIAEMESRIARNNQYLQQYPGVKGLVEEYDNEFAADRIQDYRAHQSEILRIAGAGFGAFTLWAIHKYARRARFRRLGRETQQQIEQRQQNAPRLEFEPKIDVQLQATSAGLVIKF